MDADGQQQRLDRIRRRSERARSFASMVGTHCGMVYVSRPVALGRIRVLLGRTLPESDRAETGQISELLEERAAVASGEESVRVAVQRRRAGLDGLSVELSQVSERASGAYLSQRWVCAAHASPDDVRPAERRQGIHRNDAGFRQDLLQPQRLDRSIRENR